MKYIVAFFIALQIPSSKKSNPFLQKLFVNNPINLPLQPIFYFILDFNIFQLQFQFFSSKQLMFLKIHESWHVRSSKIYSRRIRHILNNYYLIRGNFVNFNKFLKLPVLTKIACTFKFSFFTAKITVFFNKCLLIFFF